jgi:transcriptional regulator with XRE-family HTH domain
MPAISAKLNAKGTDRSDPANLVRAMRQRLNLAQAKLAAKHRVSFQSVNRWHRRSKPLPIASQHGYVLALNQIDQLLHQMDDSGKDLLTQSFSDSGSRSND